MSIEVKKSLVPKLRFPEFRETEQWKTTTLGAVAKLRNGYAFKSADYVDEGFYQIITIANVQQGYLTIESTKRLAFLPSDIQPHQVLCYRDVLISMTGNVGRVCRVTAEGLLLNQRVGKLVPEKIDDTFFYQLLQREDFRNSMQLKAAGGAQGNLSAGDITEYALSKPTEPTEQQKIADCLSSLDDLIAAQGRKVEALKTHKKGLMQQLFPSEGESQPRLRFPEFPEAGEWACMTLADIAQISSGSTPLRSNSEFFDGGIIPWVKTTDLNNGLISQTEECITPKARARVNPVGSVLVAMYGGFNQIGRTGCLSVPAATNQALSVLVLDQSRALPAYVLAWLNAKVDVWKRIASSSRKDPNITGTDVAKFPITLPLLDEQQRIASSLSSLDALIAATAQELDALKIHKRGLMQQLFPSAEVDA